MSHMNYSNLIECILYFSKHLSFIVGLELNECDYTRTIPLTHILKEDTVSDFPSHPDKIQNQTAPL